MLKQLNQICGNVVRLFFLFYFAFYYLVFSSYPSYPSYPCHQPVPGPQSRTRLQIIQPQQHLLCESVLPVQTIVLLRPVL